MNRSSAALICWVVCVAALIAIGAWGGKRTHNGADFFLASRRLNGWWVALSYAANASPTWLLLAISGAAFAWGLSAVWIWAAVMLGYTLNVFWLGPRLRQVSVGEASLTIVQVLSYEAGDRLQPLIVRSAALILSFAMLLEIGAVLTAATQMMETSFGFDATTTAITAIAVIVAFTLAGGLWSMAFADSVQVIIVLLLAACIPLMVFGVFGSTEEIRVAFSTLGPANSDLFGGRNGVVALAFVVGTSAFGFDLAGQPHALNRFMAARDERALSLARWIALLAGAILSGLMLLVGWAGSMLYAGLQQPEQALAAMAERALPPMVSACIVTLLLGTLLLAIGNRLLVLAACLSSDMKRSLSPLSFAWARIVLVFFAIAGLCVSLWAGARVIDQALFAFTLIGSAFGPLMIVRLSGKRVRPGSTLGAMWAAVMLTLLFHALPDSPGDFLERVLPFVAALGIALTGGERRRNPDRADRAQETVHDRVPI
ncbi:MAG: sodium:solute symporter family transporter [Povalibacter sp.]